jgi:hypothetical protein
MHDAGTLPSRFSARVTPAHLDEPVLLVKIIANEHDSMAFLVSSLGACMKMNSTHDGASNLKERAKWLCAKS